MNKNWIIAFTVAILAISITACGTSQQNNNAKPNQTTNNSENKA
ncbi:hypothetical protein [Paenibacillus macerans]